jgi:hypothetical protein
MLLCLAFFILKEKLDGVIIERTDAKYETLNFCIAKISASLDQVKYANGLSVNGLIELLGKKYRKDVAHAKLIKLMKSKLPAEVLASLNTQQREPVTVHSLSSQSMLDPLDPKK